VKVANTIIVVATLGAIRIIYATGLDKTLHLNDLYRFNKVWPGHTPHVLELSCHCARFKSLLRTARRNTRATNHIIWAAAPPPSGILKHVFACLITVSPRRERPLTIRPPMAAL
jgi:hypothetical protein